jgi:hypothetical protein
MSNDQRDVTHINVGEINEPVALRYDFDGNGYLYMDAGSGSDWASRVKDCEFLYTHPQKELTDEEIKEIIEQHSRSSRRELVVAVLKKASEK